MQDPAHPDKPFVQQSGSFAGFFLGMTSLRAPAGQKTDPGTYVDATRFPYVVLPSGFSRLVNVAKIGDVGFATHLDSGKTTAFIVGDSGGGDDAKLGECSVALFAALGGTNPNPRNGAGVPSGKIQYILFPGSRMPGNGIWPRTQADIDTQVSALLAKTPGISKAGV